MCAGWKIPHIPESMGHGAGIWALLARCQLLAGHMLDSLCVRWCGS